MGTISTSLLPAKIQHLPLFVEAVAEAARQAGIDPARITTVELVVEEALVNIMNHAYGEAEGDIEVTCRTDDNQWLTVEIVDSGKAFDMTSASPPNITGVLDERNVGGLGIHFVKTLANRVYYRRDSTRNILELGFSLVLPNAR